VSNALELEIRNIGKLLLGKDNQSQPANNINDIKLQIPPYQRPYKWTAKNVLQLFDDIVDAKNNKKETYRAGTLILHRENGSCNIVDGQQRIITFALLLKALNVNAGDIPFLEQPLADNPHNTHNIPANYRILERRVKNIGDESAKKELLEYVENNCQLIVVITEDISEAFQFFDSQNARGKKLYPHDLLKAYHLREMNDLDAAETETVVSGWENLNQQELSALFSDYLYRVKEWTKGNKAWELTEHNIYKFKGITRQDNFPYAQFYKGAFAYVDTLNNSTMPFVSGIGKLSPFQLDTPIVAGKPFFDYVKHYFEILKDIQNNDKYEGYFVNDNPIVKTLNRGTFKNGVGNRITRLLFDTAILLYVDRFCPQRPTNLDLEMLDQFIIFAFIWAYSLRAQYRSLRWSSAQNYIMGTSGPEVRNAFNIYKIIADSDSPASLLSTLAERVHPLPNTEIEAEKDDKNDNHYRRWFIEYGFMEKNNAD
jgi:hypothetical protein